MPLSPGDKLGPYEILAAIGKGGMGEVYRANDPRLQRNVAIKLSAQRFNERFEREARAVAALNHPNICQIYDVGPNYLVMELIEGPTLAQLIKEGPIPLDRALRIADQIGEALAEAHEKRITHRDLKPANVKVKEDGVVKVLDFGLAKIANSGGALDSEDSPTLSLSLTKEGVIMGTAAYMSPEQARGKPVDSRADVWSFGVVLYEMLTGKRLFRGEDLTETLAGVVKETPDLSLVPRKVRRLLEACLQKDPKHRLQAIGDRKLLLAEPEARPFNALWPALAGGVTLVAAALAWVHFRETPPAPQSLRYQLTRPEGKAFGELQLSPDGRYLAYIDIVGAQRLHVRGLDSLEEREFPATDGTTYPFWSPDSLHIGFFSQGKLKQIGMAGGPPVTIADAPDGRGGAWGADGTIIFAPGVTGAFLRVPASGGTPTLLNPGGVSTKERYSERFPIFLPDSDNYFYTVESENPQRVGVFVGSLSGTPPVRLLPDLSMTQFVASRGSSGFILFRRDATLMAQPFDAAALKTTGDAFAIAEGIKQRGNNGFVEAAASRNGTLFFSAGTTADQTREIVWLDRSGKRGGSVLKEAGIRGLALSPDQASLLYWKSGQLIPGDLWLHHMSGGAPQRFTFGPGIAYGAVWSPDSSAAAYVEYPEEVLVRKSAKSSAAAQRLGVSGPNMFVSSWSRDGKFLVYSQTSPATKDDIWLLPLEGDSKPKAFRQTPYNEKNGQISPDGQWMAYVSDASGQDEVYVEPLAPGSAPRQVSSGGGVAPAWRSDSRELYFGAGGIGIDIANFTGKLMAVDVTPGPGLALGTPHELLSSVRITFDNRQQAFFPSANGKQFLLVQPVSEAAVGEAVTVITNWAATRGK